MLGSLSGSCTVGLLADSSIGVRYNVEILLEQTAINVPSLPWRSTVNNPGVSVGKVHPQSHGCDHFNVLSGVVYGFLF